MGPTLRLLLSTNTRYQAGAAPCLGRTSTGWIAPACLAHSFDHLVGTAKERQRNYDAEDFRGLEIQDEHILVRTLNR
jgi:hypothetical protein